MGIGGIGGISSSNSMSSMQISSSDLKDQKSKNLQNDITDVQRQIQKLSSDEELTVTEKAEEKKKLQQEKSDLSTKLKLHQDELQKSQKREIKLAELQEDRKPEKEEASENTAQTADTSSASDAAAEKKFPADDRHAMQPGTVITQNSDGTVILKEILNQAAENGAGTQTKQAESGFKAQTKQAQTANEETDAAEKEKKADEDDSVTNAGLTEKEVQAMTFADASMQRADRQGALVTKTTDDIAVLRGEIKQDALRKEDTEGKRAALRDMQKQRMREMAFQFSMLGEADQAMQSMTDTNQTAAQTGAERTFQVSGVNAAQEDQTFQRGFQVSIA